MDNENNSSFIVKEDLAISTTRLATNDLTHLSLSTKLTRGNPILYFRQFYLATLVIFIIVFIVYL